MEEYFIYMILPALLVIIESIMSKRLQYRVETLEQVIEHKFVAQNAAISAAVEVLNVRISHLEGEEDEPEEKDDK